MAAEAYIRWAEAELFPKARKLIKMKKQYCQEVSELESDLTPLGEYISTRMPMLHRHNKCGHEFLARPNNVLQGKGCPKCSGAKKKITTST